jgi:hypothetical protein
MLERIADFLVGNQSFYVILLDESSPANVPGFMGRLDAIALEKQLAAGTESWTRNPLFNHELACCGRRGELLSWSLLTGGFFRAVIDVDVEPAESVPPLLPPTNQIPSDCDLRVPSGKLVVCCLAALGDPSLRPVACVPPGTYRTLVTRHTEFEYHHVWVESEADYPPGDGPDWTITLRRISSEAAFETS